MFKLFKQELVFIPIVLVLMEFLRHILSTYYPESAVFDRASEIESFLFSAWQMVWITSATLIILWVVFPSCYRAFKKLYLNFDKEDETSKQNYSFTFYIVLFLALTYLVGARASTTNELLIRNRLVDTLHTQLHVREATGHNDGVDVEHYLHFVQASKGNAWCAAFVSYNLAAVGLSSPPNPKTAWSPSFASPFYTVWSPQLVKQHKAKAVKPGDCFTLFYNGLGRVGHVGFIVAETNAYFITIEGNTGLSGSREGSGVHKYRRSKAKVYRVTNYINPYITYYEKNNKTRAINSTHGIVPQAFNNIYQNYGYQNRSAGSKTGLNLLCRHIDTCTNGQLGYKSIDTSGKGRRHQLTRINTREQALKKHLKDREGEIIRQLRLQRTRATTTITATAYKATLLRQIITKTPQHYSRYGTSTLHTQMG